MTLIEIHHEEWHSTVRHRPMTSLDNSKELKTRHTFIILPSSCSGWPMQLLSMEGHPRIGQIADIAPETPTCRYNVLGQGNNAGHSGSQSLK